MKKIFETFVESEVGGPLTLVMFIIITVGLTTTVIKTFNGPLLDGSLFNVFLYVYVSGVVLVKIITLVLNRFGDFTNDSAEMFLVLSYLPIINISLPLTIGIVMLVVRIFMGIGKIMKAIIRLEKSFLSIKEDDESTDNKKQDMRY